MPHYPDERVSMKRSTAAPAKYESKKPQQTLRRRTLQEMAPRGEVHIARKPNTNTFLQLLPECSPGQKAEADYLFILKAKQLTNKMCRSVAFHVDGDLHTALPKDTFGE